MQVEKRHAGNTVIAYVEGNMEHGLLHYSEKLVVFSRNQVLFVLNNTAIVVAHAACTRIIAHAHHTHGISNANTSIEVVHTNLLCDCCCTGAATT